MRTTWPKISRMRIVQHCGRYGIEWRFLFFLRQYAGLSDNGKYWWSFQSSQSAYLSCWSGDLEAVKKLHERLSTKPVPYRAEIGHK